MAHYVRSFANGHAIDTAQDIALLDEQYALSKGSDLPPEISVADAVDRIARESGATDGMTRGVSATSFEGATLAEPLGARVYEVNCMRCHGERADGGVDVAVLDDIWDSRLKSLSLAGSRRNANALRARTREVSIATGGIKPSFATLSQDEWDALSRFLSALGSED